MIDICYIILQYHIEIVIALNSFLLLRQNSNISITPSPTYNEFFYYEHPHITSKYFSSERNASD